MLNTQSIGGIIVPLAAVAIFIFAVLNGFWLVAALVILIVGIKKFAKSDRLPTTPQKTSKPVPKPHIVNYISEDVSSPIKAALPFSAKRVPTTPQTTSMPVLKPPIVNNLREDVSNPIKVALAVGTKKLPDADVFYAMSIATEKSYKIPKSNDQAATANWIPAGSLVEIAGRNISCGLIYFGQPLSSRTFTAPSTINPSLKASPHGDFQIRQLDYWPNYSSASIAARGAYLNWLLAGRRDSSADIGYVFLYFYGLEQRVLVDAANENSALEDLPSIDLELKGLLSTYASNGSFCRYANALRSWIQLVSVPEKIYLSELPLLTRGYELPALIKIALGQAVRDGVPIPAQLALAWARLAPELSLRTPATRCAAEFDAQFLYRYSEKFGSGMKIPLNKTKLRISYHAASSDLNRDGRERLLNLDDIPDVTALTRPIKFIGAIIEEVCVDLDRFSRMLGRDSNARSKLEALVELPARLWPETALHPITLIKQRISDAPYCMPFRAFLENLNCPLSINKTQLIAITRALIDHEVGFEPDVAKGARFPKLDDSVVAFKISNNAASRNDPALLQLAQLTLQLAASVAAADSNFAELETAHLKAQIAAWPKLSDTDRKRLEAQLVLLGRAPIALSALRSKLEPLPYAVRLQLACAMAGIAQADGVITPAEVNLLEKIYKVLGVDAKQIFSDLHIAATTQASKLPGGSPQVERTEIFKLDRERISLLQADSAEVALLLANVFKDNDDDPVETVLEPHAEIEAVSVKATFLGLDESHAAFARLLLTQSEWTREQLSDVAADLELMLDGALDQINEAAFDLYDVPFTEGNAPVVVNPEILEKIES